MERRSRGKLFLLGLIVALLMTCGIREDELRCEEAVAHLVSCCPGFDAKRVDCYYVPHSCGSCVDAQPLIPIEQSRCIARLDCAAVRAAGICERAQNVASTNAQVCP